VDPMSLLTYVVPEMTCDHCVSAITREVAQLPGVQTVSIDLVTKVVTVRGNAVDDAAVREAIDEAGFEANP
jgi:copper chaperone